MEGTKTVARRCHVLMLPFPSQGHVNPLLHLSRELAARDHGIIVSFLNTPHYHARMPASNSMPSNLRFLSLPSTSSMAPPDMRVPGSLGQYMRNIDLRMGEEVEDVIEGLMRQEDFRGLACLIADIRLPFAQSLADKYDIPRVAFWTQSAANLAYNVKVFGGSYEMPKDEGALIDGISPGVPRHRLREAPTALRREVVREAMYEMMRRPFLHPERGRAAAAVINTMEELEKEAVTELERDVEGPEINLCVGPLNRAFIPPDHDQETRHEVLRWLDARAPASVLYVCFGTVVCLSRSEFESLAAGIEASGAQFLWALRPGLVAGAEDDVAVLTEAFRARTGDRGLVVAWAPQPLVLAHASVGGFLSHCGWNSTLEAVSAGVPVLCRPKFGDQPLNRRCIVDSWRFGLALENDDDSEEGSLSARHVEDQIRRLMQAGVDLQQQAAALKEMASKATGVAGSSVSNICRLVQLIQALPVITTTSSS